MRKFKVLFIGSFQSDQLSAVVGGQMFACKSLIQSRLSDTIDWVLIDTTAESKGSISLITRFRKAFFRMSKFIYHLFFSKIDICLIFTADGFSFLEKGMACLIGKLFGKKVVLAPRSGIIVNDVKNSKIRKKFISFVLDKVDIVICQGETWKTFYTDLLKRNFDKLIIIQNWIDIEKYIFSKIVQNSEINEEDETINVLFLAAVDKKKGIFDLIEAVSRNRIKNVIYHIAGDGLAMVESKLLIQKFGLDNQFRFYGWVRGDNKMKLLQRADIFVLPSYYEGFPNALMEAMASGIAIIATKVGSIPDVVEHSKNGLLYCAGDIDALDKHLQLLILNKEIRLKLAKEALISVKENNSIDIAVNKFDKLFQSL